MPLLSLGARLASISAGASMLNRRLATQPLQPLEALMAVHSLPSAAALASLQALLTAEQTASAHVAQAGPALAAAPFLQLLMHSLSVPPLMALQPATAVPQPPAAAAALVHHCMQHMALAAGAAGAAWGVGAAPYQAAMLAAALAVEAEARTASIGRVALAAAALTAALPTPFAAPQTLPTTPPLFVSPDAASGLDDVRAYASAVHNSGR
jgi:hypothetical protein